MGFLIVEMFFYWFWKNWNTDWYCIQDHRFLRIKHGILIKIALKSFLKGVTYVWIVWLTSDHGISGYKYRQIFEYFIWNLITNIVKSKFSFCQLCIALYFSSNIFTFHIITRRNNILYEKQSLDCVIFRFLYNTMAK